MRRLFQEEWFNIPFEELGPVDSSRRADVAFYATVYEELWKRCSSYEQLPESWRANKDALVTTLIDHSDPGSRILSIGAGIGYIEAQLAAAGRQVLAVEPARTATRLLEGRERVNVVQGIFPRDVAENAGPWDLGIMVATEYMFTDAELMTLLEAARHRGVHRFLIGSATTYRRASPRAFWRTYGPVVLGRLRRRAPGQLWGFARTARELSKLMASAGFNPIDSGRAGRIDWFLGASA